MRSLEILLREYFEAGRGQKKKLCPMADAPCPCPMPLKMQITVAPELDILPDKS